MSPSTTEKTKLLLDELKNSKLPIDDKLDLEHLVMKAAETSNGLETPAKIAGMSDVLFGIVQLLVTDKIEGNDGNEGKLQGLFKLIEACKWQIVIISAILSGLLIFRPEVGELIKMALK